MTKQLTISEISRSSVSVATNEKNGSFINTLSMNVYNVSQ